MSAEGPAQLAGQPPPLKRDIPPSLHEQMLDLSLTDPDMDANFAAALPTQSPQNESISLHDFELVGQLGSGMFGRVQLVRHNATRRTYALKSMNKEAIVQLNQVTHVNSECVLLSTLRHPFAVELVSSFQDHENIYLVMEAVLGGEIFAHLRRMNSFSEDIARFYAAEIVLVLEYLHSRAIVYRDLKPENILLAQDGHVKLIDFGFSKILDNNRTHTMCGTPDYLAPEIILGEGYGTEVDWWALGVLIYEMLAGYPPFYDENPFQIYENILKGKVHYPPTLTSAGKDLLRRLLQLDRSCRLGGSQRGGCELKEHAWFAGIDWQALLERRIRPPIIPTIQHDSDISNFDCTEDMECQDEFKERLSM
jgi:serine/threonine protein kinase